MQVWPFPMHIDGADFGVVKLTALVLVLGDSWVGHLANFPHQHQQGEFSCVAPAISPTAAGGNKWGHFSCSHSLGAGWPIPTPPALLFCLGKCRACSPEWVLQLVRCRASSPVCCRWKGMRGTHFPHPYHYIEDEGDRVSSPDLMSSGQAHMYPCQQARASTPPCFLGEVLDLFFWMLQSVRDWVRSLPFSWPQRTSSTKYLRWWDEVWDQMSHSRSRGQISIVPLTPLTPTNRVCCAAQKRCRATQIWERFIIFF